MDQFTLKLNNVHYDTFSNEAFEFNISITCEYVKECDKESLKQIAEHQIISYMIATGKNFLRDHNSLLKYLNNYTQKAWQVSRPKWKEGMFSEDSSQLARVNAQIR